MKTPRQKRAMGIDFGGTTIKLGLVGEQGKILARATISTKGAASQAEWFSKGANGLQRVRARADVFEPGFAGIGIGVPGFVDFDRGHIYQLTNVAGWDGVHVAKEMEDRFHVRVFVDNDVNAMALGECTFGSGDCTSMPSSLRWVPVWAEPC